VKVHFIAIGGAVMHNLALELQGQGLSVTGSDDEIYEPSLSRLSAAGLMPERLGWFPERIAADLDAVVLGMHARADNPELARARELGLRIYSYPEFICSRSERARRVVVAGSHGKTTTTAMILHALRTGGFDFDYLVGAQIEGFQRMVRLSGAPILVVEGDEYLASALDPAPKFLRYRPHLAVVTGVAWDHINVFPTLESYLSSFVSLAEALPPDGELFWCGEDPELAAIAARARCRTEAYGTLPHETGPDGRIWAHGRWPVGVFGAHNLQNMSAALAVCRALGMGEEDFFRAMATFRGAAKRLQPLVERPAAMAWLDFAHAPSKVRATVEAVRARFPERPLRAVLELHTFSSLNPDFLPQYRGALDPTDQAAVFLDDAVFALKRMEPLSEAHVRAAFGREDLLVLRSPDALRTFVGDWDPVRGENLLLMSSGKLGGFDLRGFAANFE
jgi:UDP-N-acetylmuramate: L-alanyl-gamma-D-glutamyl-meso-diaminopimelate ligase